MQHRITIEGSDQAYVSHAGQSVLDALVGSASAVAVGCRGGGCGVCRVQVLSGDYALGVMSAEQVTEECRSKSIVLACRLMPLGDLHLRALGKRVNRCTQPDTAELLRKLTLRADGAASNP